MIKLGEETGKIDLSMKTSLRKSDQEIQLLQGDLSTKLRDFEKLIDQLKESIIDKIDSEKFEDYKKQADSKMLQFSNRIRESKIRYDPLLNEMNDMRRLKEQFLDHEERAVEFQSITQNKIVTASFANFLNILESNEPRH